MSWNNHIYTPPASYESTANFVKFGMVKMGTAAAKGTVYFGAEIAGQLQLKAGDHVSVEIGENEHDGMIRIAKTANGTFQIKERKFRGKASSLYVQIGPVEKFGKAKRETEIVVFKEQGDGSIILELPKWYQKLRECRAPAQTITPTQREAQEVRARLR